MFHYISPQGKNLEYGLKEIGLLSFVRELNGNEEEQYEKYLNDVSMYARGKIFYPPSPHHHIITSYIIFHISYFKVYKSRAKQLETEASQISDLFLFCWRAHENDSHT